MKIQERSVSPVEAVERAESKPDVAAKSSVRDAGASVKISAAAVALSSDVSDVARSKHVQDIKAAFERGESIVNHDRIADAMIKDAEDHP